MTTKKISELTAAGALAGTEPLPIVQSSVTKKTTVQDVANLLLADPEIGALAGLTSAADKIPYFTGSGTASLLTRDTDTSLAANSDTRLATQKAVKAYVDAIATSGASDVMIFKGVIDCSTNPNYPAADAGNLYKISVAGKIGGGSGPNVEVGDTIYCITDSTAAGTHASVGSNWVISQVNVDGAVTGPASATDNNVALFNGSTGKIIKDSGLTLSGTNTGDQLVFKTIAVSGQSDVVADSTTDTLTLVGAGGITITTNAGSDTITFTGASPSTVAGINAQTGTSYTAVLGDAGYLVTMNNASANTFTVPPNSSVAYPIDTFMYVAQIGAGATTIVAGSGVTINAPSSLTLARYVMILLVKTGTDTWLFVGGASSGSSSSGTKTYEKFTPMTSEPPAANFATLDTRNGRAVLEFDASTEEAILWNGLIPEGASLGSGLKIRVHWRGDTATSGDVVWGAAVERDNDSDYDADSFDTEATAAGTVNGTSGKATVTEITLTTIDSLTAGDGFYLKLARKATSGSDTMSGDAQVSRVEVRSAA